MTELNRKQIIDTSGGLINVNLLPRVISSKLFDEIQSTINYLETEANSSLIDNHKEGRVEIVVTASTSLICTVRALNVGNSIILVPIGFAARMRVLSRLLLRFWNQEGGPQIVYSALDPLPLSDWHLPPKLVPVFCAIPDWEDAVFWQKLKALDSEIGLDERFEGDIVELIHLLLVYMICHKFAHIFSRHFDFLKWTKRNDCARKYGVREDEVRLGLEVAADIFAAQQSINILNRLIGEVHGYDNLEAFSRGFLRQSYAVTMLFASFDIHNKNLGAYKASDYSHPMVRHLLFVDSVSGQISILYPSLMELWKEVEQYGWGKCIFSFQHLNLEAMAGKFGNEEGKELNYPIQSLNYTLSGSMPLRETYRQALATHDKVMDLFEKFDEENGGS